MRNKISPHDPDALLREIDAADFLSMSPRTLQAWRYRGMGPAYCTVGRAVRYRRKDLIVWVEQNLVGVEGVGTGKPSPAQARA